MEGDKSALLTPGVFDDCLNNGSDFQIIRNNRDMRLSLNSSKSNTDQTPTPTRLIRNCEEFGLFDDLKHVNPFEETFRQAIDDKSKHTQKTLDDEDTLHTPNICYNSILSDNKDATKPETGKNTLCEEHPTVIPKTESKNVETKDSQDSHSNSDTDVRRKCLLTSQRDGRADGTHTVYRKIHPKPIVVPTIYSSLSPTKEKIRQSLLKLQPRNKNSIEADAPTIDIALTSQTNALETSKTEVKQQAIRKKNYVFKNIGDNERNREAAKRYRNKQKVLHDAIMLRNTQLEAENTVLRKQLNFYKRAYENYLKAHKSCDI